MRLSRETRLKSIPKWLKERPQPSVTEIAARSGVTEQVIRRDLREMDLKIIRVIE